MISTKTTDINITKNGLFKPYHISPELATFLGCAEDDMKSRVEVSQAVCNYIREHNLQNPQDRFAILPDETLERLFNHNPIIYDRLSYYMLLTLLKHHFIKL